jgi:carboxyl-terminal processing protease
LTHFIEHTCKSSKNHQTPKQNKQDDKKYMLFSGYICILQKPQHMTRHLQLRFYVILWIFILSAPANHILAQKADLPIVRSNTENVHYIINNQREVWGISPEVNPDRLRVYCEQGFVAVTFTTDIDTIHLKVKDKDTVSFYFLLKGKDRALTQVIGVKEIPNNISNYDKLYFLSLFWSEVKYNFVNIDKYAYSLDSVYKSYIPRVLSTKNDFDYYQELKRFAAQLHDGHTEIVSNSQFHEYRDYIDIIFNDYDKHIYITKIAKGTPFVDSTFIGAELIEIEGIPVIDYLTTNVFPFVSASTEQGLWMTGVFNLHSGLKSNVFNCKVRKVDGKVIGLSLPYNGSKFRSPNEKYWGPPTRYPSDMVEFKWLDDSIAYVDVNSFYPDKQIISEFDHLLPSIYKSKGIIIDLRSNGGGSTEVAWHIQSFLTKGRYFMNFGFQTRVNDGVRKANGNWIPEDKAFFENNAMRYDPPDTIHVSDTIKRFTVPVAILIGRYTFSAAEDFLINLYEVPGRPVLIGQSTGGSTGSPLVVPDLPGDGYGRICTRRVCFPYSGKPFVNAGIEPDIFVPRTLNDFLAGTDATLQKGLSVIKSKIAK